VRTPENTGSLRAATRCSPRRKARMTSNGPHNVEQSVRRIPLSDLLFYPYKLHIVQELSDRDFASGSTFCEQFVTSMNEQPVT
jgi:hypothetical protein